MLEAETTMPHAAGLAGQCDRADAAVQDQSRHTKQSAFFYAFPESSPQQSAASDLACPLQDLDPSALEDPELWQPDNAFMPETGQMPASNDLAAQLTAFRELKNQCAGDAEQIQADVPALSAFPPLTDLLAELWHTDGPLTPCSGSFAQQVIAEVTNCFLESTCLLHALSMPEWQLGVPCILISRARSCGVVGKAH